MKILDSFLEVKTTKRTNLQIVFWWELRRLLYNAIVLVAGFLSIGIMLKASSGIVQLNPGEDFYEPVMILIFAFLSNLFYTLGWFTEIIIKRSITYGPKMFKRGLYFTLFWIFLPSFLWLIYAIVYKIEN